jgi:hypothetical protein
MQLTDEQIKKFQEIYLQSFGKKINGTEALKKGASLVRLYDITYKNKFNKTKIK